MAVLALGVIPLFQGSASAISFDIKPVRIFLDARTKIEKIVVKNTSDEDISLQLKAYKWSQDAEGKDAYEETSDIIVFPKIVTMKKEEDRIIRVGTKLNSGAIEKTYRIYINEIPVAGDAPQGAALRMLVKAGIPLFLSPLKPTPKGKIESISVKHGMLEMMLKNDGNLHFIIRSITVRGKNAIGEDLFEREIGGWYLLSGASRLYTTQIPQEICQDVVKLDTAVKTDRFTLHGGLDVNKAMCLP